MSMSGKRMVKTRNVNMKNLMKIKYETNCIDKSRKLIILYALKKLSWKDFLMDLIHDTHFLYAGQLESFHNFE